MEEANLLAVQQRVCASIVELDINLHRISQLSSFGKHLTTKPRKHRTTTTNCSAMNVIHNFQKKGFVVMYRAVPDDETDHLRSLARDNKNLWIHETWNDVLTDDNRVAEWQFLKTVAGASNQLVRRRFSPDPVGDECVKSISVPGSLYIATEDNTYIYGYGWNHNVAMVSDRQHITLNKGDLILMGGDFIYARAGSRSNNVCVHASVDSALYERPLYQPPEFVTLVDDTRWIEEHFCFVWNCPFRGTGQHSLRRHLNRYHKMVFRNVRMPHSY
ncbi:hypothetical protein PPTG_18496 [Phytophthora nicotianae INRA-310]|uniref:Uncharacterized protein n=1 Tax=Phytophthora nicotianae (strain INRA-310) TaxID=761204 RepID=W2PI87_PHYN3|nr:hypothetical protein PPTG_18496 [Phytophthora nicotianae INRA-310]ETM99739.1 hypothetical protein PPTG_18496 [Phytophthora nicotianae INRA-310]